jgi:hypothetical protein
MLGRKEGVLEERRKDRSPTNLEIIIIFKTKQKTDLSINSALTPNTALKLLITRLL